MQLDVKGVFALQSLHWFINKMALVVVEHKCEYK